MNNRVLSWFCITRSFSFSPSTQQSCEFGNILPWSSSLTLEATQGYMGYKGVTGRNQEHWLRLNHFDYGKTYWTTAAAHWIGLCIPWVQSHASVARYKHARHTDDIECGTESSQTAISANFPMAIWTSLSSRNANHSKTLTLVTKT